MQPNILGFYWMISHHFYEINEAVRIQKIFKSLSLWRQASETNTLDISKVCQFINNVNVSGEENIPMYSMEIQRIIFLFM